ncbi:hypothetical protein [Streptomyces sp. NPDC086989]|uniref:hypothetical protein n=1 Tax=Streptomyces sp. NPDC086989 TaxID=3365764 RepID=UPI00381F845F
MLRGFFRCLDEDSDFLIADEPLPRFLDDAAAAKLLAAALATRAINQDMSLEAIAALLSVTGRCP